MSHEPAVGYGFAHLLSGLRDGRAGWGPRAGLSLGAAAGSIGLALLALGTFEAAGVRVKDEHAAVVIPMVIAAWLGAVYCIWATFSRWRWLLRTAFLCLVLWAVAIGTAVLLDNAWRNSEMVIGGVIALTLGATIAIIVSAAHQLARGRPVLLADGSVSVKCPGCGYSMAGLDSSVCPECGRKYTLDKLIRAQDYEATRTEGVGP